MENKESLQQSLNIYNLQLSQITETLKVTPPGEDRDNLMSLKTDVEELLKLTHDSIDSIQDAQPLETKDTIDAVADDDDEDDPFSKEYALFKAELESLDNETSTDKQIPSTNELICQEEEDEEEETRIQDELQSLLGSKCRAPYTDKSDSTTFYNALISGLEISNIENIKVRVLFINPTEKKMIPCPYFLDDKCKFSEDNCNFSHGYLVPFDQLKEYVAPDFSLLKPGCRVLAKVPNVNTWISTVLEDIGNNDICIVKQGRSFVEIPIQDILPLVQEGGNCSNKIDANEYNVDEDEEEENDLKEMDELILAKEHHKEAMIELSLSREQPTNKLGEWEKFTKGIGSKLMAKMGYIVGTGLGKSGEGILKPVEPVILPAGKSLDHCMNLKEAAGGSKNLFSLERMQKKLAAKALAQSKRQYLKQKKQEKDVFYVINNTICAVPSTSNKNSTGKHIIKNLTTVSDRQLNVERFKLAEYIKQSERNIKFCKRSIKSFDDHKAGKNVQKNVFAKLESQQRELVALKNSDNKLEREQIRRKTKKKMTIF